jgi:ADP-heptose:LPS heptosyltransferase
MSINRPFTPHRIVILKPCCIGDVIFATPLLSALRTAFPAASIDWAAGSSAIAALRGHPALRAVLDTGPLANPASQVGSLLRLVRLLRKGRYDLMVVPDRSRLLALAALLTGIPQRAGLDSAGRGIGYTIKAPIDPRLVRHEADIYLDVARAMRLDTRDCWANTPPTDAAQRRAQDILHAHHLTGRPLILVHPGGGVNPGMTMIQKRWPPARFAVLADRIAAAIDGNIAVLGARSDADTVRTFAAALKHPLAADFTDRLSLSEIGALAERAAIYVGNDNGVAHLAAASGGRVLMIFGPSDPRRYAPFVPPDRGRYVWRQVALPAEGVWAGGSFDFDWERDGVSVDEAWEQARLFLESGA